MFSPRNLSVLSVFLILFTIGFALMGYEMLGSRYLNPYFGGGITTWAALISVVLLAMMVGYMTGGYIVDARPTVNLLSIAAVLAGFSIMLVPVIVDWVMESVLVTFGDGLIGVLLAAAVISFLPVALLSACSPFVVRLLLRDLNTGGQVAGWVHGVSTLGNVFGTLVTTFVFIPSFGTRTITLYFGGILILLGVIVYLVRSRVSGGLHYRHAGMLLCVAFLSSLLYVANSEAQEANNIPASYPEGPLWVKDTLYIAEMPSDRISILKDNKLQTFWSEKGCGPTSITPYSGKRFVVTCHMGAKLVVINADGKKVSDIKADGDKRAFQDPNDSHTDGNGGVFFTDSGLFSKGAPATGRIYHLDASGRVKTLKNGFTYANGIAFDPLNRALYVSEHLAGKVWKFKLNKTFGILSAKVFLDVNKVWSPNEFDYAETGPDGIEILKDGSIAVAVYGKGTVLVVRSNGISQYKVDTKYVTNISVSDQGVAIVGAYKNNAAPYPGNLHIVAKRLFKRKIKL